MNVSVLMSNNALYIEHSANESLYRKPHDIEIKDYDSKQWQYMGDGYRLGRVRAAVINDPKGNPEKKPMPEVYRVLPDHQTPLNCDWQWFWRNLNPELTDTSWSSLMGDSLAWMNNTGARYRRNCILNTNTDSDKFPAFDAPRLCGGAILKRKLPSNDGLFHVEGLMTSDPIPDPADIINKWWLWYWGISVRKDGGVNYIMRMGKDGTLKRVRIPILSKYSLYLPESFIDKLPKGTQYKEANTFG